MNERDYHDHHYEVDAARIQGSPLFRRVHQRSARQFLRRTGAGRAHRVLSLGCGDGSIERHLAPHVAEIVGLDLSPVAIGQAQAQAQAAGLRNVTFAVSAAGTPLESFGRFDFVAAFAVLHHLRDTEIGDTLRAARKVLRSGGAFYSSDPSRRRLVRYFAGLVRGTYDRYHSPDERELEPAALAALVEAAGLSRPVVFYTDYFLGPLAWLAPRTPDSLGAMLEAIDNLALRVPLLRRYASSFSLCATCE